MKVKVAIEFCKDLDIWVIFDIRSFLATLSGIQHEGIDRQIDVVYQNMAAHESQSRSTLLSSERRT